MSNSLGRFVWIELMTTDTAAATDFYHRVVGWRPQVSSIPGMTYTQLLAGDTPVGGLMALTKDVLDAGVKPCWLGYLEVNDVDATAAKLQEAGGALHRPPADIPGAGRFAVVADPQGAVFNLLKPMQPQAPGPAHQLGHVGWRELHTTNWPSAFDFYSGLFGWLKGDGVDMGPMGTYQLYSVAGESFGGMFNSPAAAQFRPFWLYYFQVEGIDAAAARITAGGGTILNPPHQVPGGDWIVQAADPQGAMFALLGNRVTGT